MLSCIYVYMYMYIYTKYVINEFNGAVGKDQPHKELHMHEQSVDGTGPSVFITVAKMKKATVSTTLARTHKIVLTVDFFIFATVNKHERARPVYGLIYIEYMSI
jgi:hypothetical protein